MLLLVLPLLRYGVNNITCSFFLSNRFILLNHFLETCANAATKCENGGYPDPKFNCAICKCPSGFAGSLCDQLPTSSPIACGGLIAASMQWQMLAGNAGLLDDDSITMQDYAFCHWRITVNNSLVIKILIKINYLN
jgi:hypothetical protein